MFAHGREASFDVDLEKPGLRLVRPGVADPPSWTRLTYHQCPGCPLKENEHPRCPVALSLVPVIRAFSDVLSHDEAFVEVDTPSRRYSATTKSAHAIGSLIGIYMAAAGCPVLDKLRPMLLTHLPFATVEESTSRAISTYLMAQYALHRRGAAADWDLKGFVAHCAEVQSINRAFVRRLSTHIEQDAPVNAVVLLNCFSSASSRNVTGDRFDEIEPLFSAYLRPQPGPASGEPAA